MKNTTNVILREHDGTDHEAKIPDSEIVEEHEFPDVIQHGGKTYRCVGSVRQGKARLYYQCRIFIFPA